MSKIKIVFEDKEYTLEYSRYAITKLEDLGLRTDEIESKFLTNISLLFYGAFMTHHKEITQEKTNIIFDQLKDIDKLIEILTQMYAYTINKLLGDTTTKNINWEVAN